jgi:hypothetical protein
MNNNQKGREQAIMNVTEYTQLMNKPNAISELQTVALEKVLMSFLIFKAQEL